jgi:hypothetical protein
MIQKLARSYTSLGRAILRYPHAPWEDALSHGQLQSKAWAIHELLKLDRDLGFVFVVGGWLGTLALLMAESSLRFSKIRSFDIDPTCEAIADQLNTDSVIAEWRFKAVTHDMFDIDYVCHRYQMPVSRKETSLQIDRCDTVINTSCDHIANFSRWWSMIPAGKLVVLQNNDFVAGGSDHVNTVTDLDAFRAQAPMATILMQGQLPLMKYNRFMLIGLK